MMPTMYVIKPKTAELELWLREHTDGMWYAGGLAIEHRYIHDLLQDIQDSGFVWKKDYEIIC